MLNNDVDATHVPLNRALVGNKILDHWDVVGASPVGAAPITSSFSTHGFNELGKGNYVTKRETFKFLGFGVAYIWDLTVYVRDTGLLIHMLVVGLASQQY